MKHTQLSLSRHFDGRQIVRLYFLLFFFFCKGGDDILLRDEKVAWRKGKLMVVLLEIRSCTSNKRNACSLALNKLV